MLRQQQSSIDGAVPGLLLTQELATLRPLAGSGRPSAPKSVSQQSLAHLSPIPAYNNYRANAPAGIYPLPAAPKMQVLAEAASREADLQAKQRPASIRRVGTKQATATSKQQQQQPPGSPMPRIHTLSKITGVNQLTSKQVFTGQKIVSQQQNLLNHKIQQTPHKVLQQASASASPLPVPAPPAQNHQQQTFKQIQQKQQKQQKSMANANVLKSSSLPNIPNLAKIPANSNIVLTGKQQPPSLQPMQQVNIPQQMQRSQSVVSARAQQLTNVKSQQLVSKQQLTAATIKFPQQQQLSNAKPQQQHMLLKIAAQNKSSLSGSVKSNLIKATSAPIKATNQQPPQTVIQQPMQRNQIVSQSLAITQQQRQQLQQSQQLKQLQQPIQTQHVVATPQNTQKQPGCIKTITPHKPNSKNVHPPKSAGIKTSLNTNMNAIKSHANLATVNSPMTNSTQQKSSIKRILPQQSGGIAVGVSTNLQLHKIASQTVKIQPQSVQQRKQVIMTTAGTQYSPTMRPASGKMKNLMSVNVFDTRKDNELKLESKLELKQESEEITSSLTSSQISQSPQRRMPLPYECLQFVLQDHNYGAPPPRTPPPQSPPPHLKQQPINGAGNACVNTQHSYIFNQELSDTLRVPAVSNTTAEDDAGSTISSETGREVEPEGEETETAPEGEGDDEDSVTRCICDFEHDDGYMICCDRCLVWQHVDCMGIDRANIPDEYLCEICRPRRVDRARARALQMRKREELLNSDTTSDSSSTSSAETDAVHNIPAKNRKTSQQQSLQQQSAPRRKSDPPPQVRRLNNNNNNNNNVAKRQRRDTHPRQASMVRAKKEATNLTTATTTTTTIQPTKPQRGGGPGKRKTKRRTSLEEKEGEVFDSWGSNMAPLRQWIERYEEAVTNHYSPELRARISNIKVNGTHNDLRQCNIGTTATGKCRLNVQSNSLRFLIATIYLPLNTPVVELRGKYMLSTQHRPSHPQGRQHVQRPGPFVFFYRLPRDGTEVCVDTRTYGNDARFVRRSCKPNAEIKHCIEKGTLHLYIVTNTAIEKNAEITIKHDQHDLMLSPNSNNSGMPIMCACNNPKDCQIASLTSSISTNKKGGSSSLPENADGRERRRRCRRNTLNEDANDSSISTTSSLTINDATHATPVVSTATPTQQMPKKTVTINTNVTVKEIGSIDSSVITSISNNDKNINSSSSPTSVRQIVKDEPQQSVAVITTTTTASSPQSASVSSQSPSKSVPATSTPASIPQVVNIETKKDKKKMTREERKMEAIMKAFERLEKAEQRKQEVQARNAQRKESGGTHSDNEEGAGQQSSKTRQRDPHQSSDKGPRRKRRKGRTRSTSGLLPHGTRRTRLNSAESDLTSGDESNSMQSPPSLASQNCSYSLRVHSGKESNNGMAVNSAGAQTGIPSAAGLLLALANSSTLGSSSPPQHQPQQPTPVKSPSGDSGASSSSQSSTPSTPLSSACLLVAAAVGPLAPGFKFPKTKKLLMNEWLKEAPEPHQGQSSESRTSVEFAEQSSAEFLSQNYAAKGLATLVQAAHSVAGICDSPPQRTAARQAAATPTPTLSTGSAKKRWLRQAISEECDSPNSNRPDSPPSEMIAPPKKRRIARESLSSDNYTPPTTPTMMQQEHGPMHRPSITEEDFVEHIPSPSTEDLGSQNEYDSDQIKDEIKFVTYTADPNTKTKSPVSPNLAVIKDEVQISSQLKIKEESKSEDEECSVNNIRNILKSENEAMKIDCELESKVLLKIKSEPINATIESFKIEKKSMKYEEIIEKGTVEIVDQNEQDIETDELSSPIAAMESDAELKKRVAELRLEFGGGMEELTNLCNEGNNSFEEETRLVQVKNEEDKCEDNSTIDEFDVEAQMKKITGDDGDDYKEKVNTSLERDKSVDGIEGLMESSKEDSESESENRETEDFRECQEFFEKSIDKLQHAHNSEERLFKEFEWKKKTLTFKEEFTIQQSSLTKADDLKMKPESLHATNKKSLEVIEKQFENIDNVTILKDIDSYPDSEAKKQDYKSASAIPTPEESMMELDSMELPSEDISEEPAKVFPSIPPLSERIRKKLESNPVSKTKLEMDTSIIESSLDMEVTDDIDDGQEKKVLSTALRELLEAKIESDIGPTHKLANKDVTENTISVTSESNQVEQTLIEETSYACLTSPSINDQISRNVDNFAIKLDPPPYEPVKDPRLKDPRTVVPNKATVPTQTKTEGPPPVKRKLSISEYRKRKQQSTGTPPEPESADMSTDGKSVSRGRSDSASSGTSSLSSDDESATKAPLDIPCLGTLPIFANTENDEKKVAEDGVIGWSAAPTLVERQRENLTERLKREFGLFLNDDEEERVRKQGLSGETLIKSSSVAGVNSSAVVVNSSTTYPVAHLPPQAYIPPPGSASVHYIQYSAVKSSGGAPVIQYPNYSVPPPPIGPVNYPPPAINKAPATIPSTMVTNNPQQHQSFVVPQAPPGSNPYPPAQFPVAVAVPPPPPPVPPPAPVPPPSNTTVSISRFPTVTSSCPTSAPIGINTVQPVVAYPLLPPSSQIATHGVFFNHPASRS